MDSIPPTIRSLTKAHPLTLLYWLSEELYRRLWRWAEGHFLMRLQERIDWAPAVIAALQAAELIRSWLPAQQGWTESQRQAVTVWLDSLDKIVADELLITRNAEGTIVSVQELPKKQKGSYRIASATDLDATFRVHGEQVDFGYNVSVAATDTFIREIQADTGSQPDPVAIPDLLQAQQEHHGVLPPKLIYDQAAGTGKHHAEVAEVSGGQTQLVAPLVPYHERSERFGPDDFALSPDGTTLTCPQGRESSTAYRSQSGGGRVFRFSAQQCRGCPLAQPCRGDEVPADHMRQVFVSDHRSVLAQARTYAQTEAYKEDLKARATIERIIANLVRYHGARYARRRGQRQCDFQVKMNAMAFNLRQWVRAWDRRRPAQGVGQA